MISIIALLPLLIALATTPPPTCPDVTRDPAQVIDPTYVANCAHCIPQKTPTPYGGVSIPTVSDPCFCATLTAAPGGIGVMSEDDGNESGSSSCPCSGVQPTMTPTYSGDRYYSVDADYLNYVGVYSSPNGYGWAWSTWQVDYPQSDSCPVGGQVGLTWEWELSTTDNSSNLYFDTVNWDNSYQRSDFSGRTNVENGYCWTKSGSENACYYVMPKAYGRTLVNQINNDYGYYIKNGLVKYKQINWGISNIDPVQPITVRVKNAKWLCDSQSPDDVIFLKSDPTMKRLEQGSTYYDNAYHPVINPVDIDNKCGGGY